MRRRVVVTGTGVVSPVGEGTEEFWNSIISGKSGVDKVKSFDVSKFKTKYAAEIKNFSPEKYMKKSNIHKIGRCSQFAIAASKMALEQARIGESCIKSNQIGISLGTTMGEIQVEEEVSKRWVKEGLKFVPKSLFDKYPSVRIPQNLAAEFGFVGPNIIIPTACAAGNYAIGYAFDLIRYQKIDMALAGGVDPLSRVAFTGFNRLLSSAPFVCQPFDKNRKGIIVGEGAGILFLESLESAIKRGVDIIAEVLGYGLGCDAYHMTAPSPDGKGGIKAINDALKFSGVTKERIDYISAHGTGTRENDRIETKIIKKAFGERAKKIPVSSIKSMIGHTMGAASGIEAVTCAYVVKNDLIPPTINYCDVDSECDLDYVPNKFREQKVDIALSNAYAFGGNDAVLLIGKYNDNYKLN